MPSSLERIFSRTALSVSAWAGQRLARSRLGRTDAHSVSKDLRYFKGNDLDFVATLSRHAAKHYSQNGEDGVLECLFDIFGTTNRYYVEIGTEAGEECNTRWLREHGWTGVMIDCEYEDRTLGLYREFVTAENVASLLAKYGVPHTFDLLSIDIDGNDYWIWKAICAAYTPRVVVVEFSCAIPLDVSVTMPYDPMFRWTGEHNTGQSLLAVQRLGERMGYSLLYADPPNAFLVRRSMLPPGHEDLPVGEACPVMHGVFFQLQRRLWDTENRYLSWVYPEMDESRG